MHILNAALVLANLGLMVRAVGGASDGCHPRIHTAWSVGGSTSCSKARWSSTSFSFAWVAQQLLGLLFHATMALGHSHCGVLCM